MEIHPPEHPLHTRRDFLIHMGTITLGLLIALGLEATVEYAHHRHQVKETRAALAEELEVNKKATLYAQWVVRRERYVYTENLKTLRYVRAHPNTRLNDLPGAIYWTALDIGFERSAWETAKTTGITSYMRREEVAGTDELYTLLQKPVEADREVFHLMERVSAPMVTSDADPTHLSQQQLDKMIEGVEEILAQETMVAVYLQNLSEVSGFPKTFTVEDLIQLHHRQKLDEVYGASGAVMQKKLNEFKDSSPK